MDKGNYQDAIRVWLIDQAKRKAPHHNFARPHGKLSRIWKSQRQGRCLFNGLPEV